MKNLLGVMLLACAMVATSAIAQTSQLPDFTYQGRLQQNGQPASGAFDLSFTLHDAASGGTQIGGAINEPQFPVTDGLFTVSLAFPGAFTGQQRWLQVSVNGQPLLPRQPVSTTPVAQYALDGNPGATGAQGPAGPAGPTGAAGATGAQGPAGATGPAGAQGPSGPAGADGAPGATGPAGAAGAQGPAGAAGEQGPAGAPGAQGPAGAPGAQGAAGAVGAQGPAGPAGPAGDVGAQGPTGPAGSAGVQGPAGPAGDVGAQGPAGPEGSAGAQGPAGPAGTPGAQGLPGNDGAPGAAGATGPAGPQGEPGESFADAPADGRSYVRRNNAWVEIDPASGGPTMRAAILADAPTLYFPLDEAPSASVFDDLGSADIDVTLSGAAITLKPGWSRLFPTSDASYLRTNEGNGKAAAVGNPFGTTTPSASLTVEAIFSPQTNGSGFQPILFVGDDPPAAPVVSFGVVNLQPRIQVGDQARVDLSGLTAGATYHIAAVVDVAVNEVRIYINGRLLQVQGMFGYPYTLVSPKVHVASHPVDDRPFTYATLGHVALFYGQALSVSQIAEHAKAAGLYGR